MVISSNFKEALTFSLRWEGGYSNHPSDKGGATNKGVTQATYNTYRLGKGQAIRDVRHLLEAEMYEIYHDSYWMPAKCDILPRKLAIAHFDWCINSGVAQGSKDLQGIVGTTPDGIIGSKSISAIQGYLTRHGELRLLIAYSQKRHFHYVNWAKGSQKVFLQGWLNRLNSLDKYLQGVA